MASAPARDGRHGRFAQVDARQPRPEPGEDLIGDGAPQACQLAGGDARSALTTEQDELLVERHLAVGGDVGDVRTDRVHRDAPDQRHEASAQEGGSAGPGGASPAIRIADGQGGDDRRPLSPPLPAVADGRADRQRLDPDGACLDRHRRPQLRRQSSQLRQRLDPQAEFAVVAEADANHLVGRRAAREDRLGGREVPGRDRSSGRAEERDGGLEALRLAARPPEIRAVGEVRPEPGDARVRRAVDPLDDLDERGRSHATAAHPRIDLDVKRQRPARALGS